MVKTSADSLLTVINDILDFSKIEAGKLELESIEFNLRESMFADCQNACVCAHSNESGISCDIDPEVPEQVVGDLTRLRQILLNLVGNAIKFTERGGIGLSIVLKSEYADSSCFTSQ